MDPQRMIRWFAAVFVLVLLAGTAYSADVCVTREPRAFDPAVGGSQASLHEVGRAEYTGTIRVYINEPTSRWWDNAGQRYHFGFLDWGLVEAITVPDGGVWTHEIEWKPVTAGWSGVSDTNIQATVAIFNSAGYTADAYPGQGYWFTAHNADAAAAARPGQVGWNSTAQGFTHTVFIEQGSATW